MPELLKPRQEEINEQEREQLESLQPIDPAEIERQIEELREAMEAYNKQVEAQIQTTRNLGSTALK